jgi:hypothetical protein
LSSLLSQWGAPGEVAVNLSHLAQSAIQAGDAALADMLLYGTLPDQILNPHSRCVQRI